MMKIDISFIHPGQEEGDEPAGSYQVETDRTDWSNITPDEVRARQKARDSFELPNGEVLDIKPECFTRERDDRTGSGVQVRICD